MENIDAIAVKTLDAEMPLITARAVARMAAKDTVAAVAAQRRRRATAARAPRGPARPGGQRRRRAHRARRHPQLVHSLPGEIHLARLPLPPGEYKLKIELHGRDERVLDPGEIKIAIRKGEKKYVSRHWIPTNLEVRP